MIDLNAEQLISFKEAARLLPPGRNGHACHIATIYRWSDRGCRGVRLESLRIGGRRCTSREAMQRFADRLTDPKPRLREAPYSDTPDRVRRRLARVDEELDRKGI